MICLSLYYSGGFPDDSVLKNLTANSGDVGLIPWWGRFPWRRKWQSTPIFLPGESPWMWIYRLTDCTGLPPLSQSPWDFMAMSEFP